MSRFAEGRWVLPLVLLVAALVMAPLFADPYAISLNDDWTQIIAFQSYLHDSVLYDGVLPQRSHLLGNGFPINGHPEYPIFSPLTLLVLAFGPALGLKLIVAVVFSTGVLGMWHLCRGTYGLAPGPASYAAMAYATGGWFASIAASGNFPQIYYYWLPLLAWLVLPRVGERLQGRLPLGRLAAAGVVMATALTDGHLNTVCVLLMLGFWSLCYGWDGVRRMAVFGVIGLGLALYKLVPTVALLLVEDRSIDSASQLDIAPFDINDFAGFRSTVFGFALGWLPWILGMAALPGLRKRRRAVAPVLGLFVLGWWFYAAFHAPIDLFGLLHRLPIFSSMDAPSKYFVFFMGFFAILAGALALGQVPERWQLGVGLAAALVVAVPLWWSNAATYRGIFAVEDIPARSRPYESLDTDYFISDKWFGPKDQRPDLYVYYRYDIPLARWEDNFQLPVVASIRWNLDREGVLTEVDDWPGEVWLPTGQGSAVLESVGPNSLTATVHATEATTMLSGQRYETGWDCGALPARNEGGRLAVDVPAGRSRVGCSFRSGPLTWGLVGSAAMVLGLLGVGFWRRRGRV